MRRLSIPRFLSDTSGNVLMIFGLSFLFLVGIGGAGYDLGRQQLVRQKIQQAADAAALGGATMINGAPSAQRDSTARAFFALNYPPDYLGVPRPTPTVIVSPDANVYVTADANVQTAFVRTFGIDTMNSKGTSIVQIRKAPAKIDLILVMDNSGSMRLQDVGATNFQNASPGYYPRCVAGVTANNPSPFLPALYCLDNFYIGFIGPSRLNALRYSASKLTEDLINPNPNNHRMALVTWDSVFMEELAFTDTHVPVLTWLSTMYSRGGTNSTTGLQRAQNMVPQFRPDTVRAVILMTDGFNGGSLPQNTAFNASSVAVCNTLKSTPQTLVFTIGFGNDLNSVTYGPIIRQFLSDCATGPNGPSKPNENIYYFAAPNAAALDAAFTAIAGSLQKVKILQ